MEALKFFCKDVTSSKNNLNDLRFYHCVHYEDLSYCKPLNISLCFMEHYYSNYLKQIRDKFIIFC